MDNKMKKKKFFCSNCGKNGHIYKNCNQPIISFGIILLSIEGGGEIRTKINNSLINPTEEKEYEYYGSEDGIKLDEIEDIEVFCKFKNKIKFLLIRRKHTLGYMEFIRGRYFVDNIDGIIFLFKQMTPNEIKKIGNSTFDELWDEVWGENKKNLHQYEYSQSKKKFEKLKNEGENLNANELNLNFYVQNVNPTWNEAEWGFPKGRRNGKEEDLDCAIREFSEETSVANSEFALLDKILPIEERLIGTNGISYKHVYYVGLYNDDNNIKLNPENISQNEEIGDIGFYTFEEAMKMIRPYHTEKKKILTQLYLYTINKILSFSKD